MNDSRDDVTLHLIGDPPDSVIEWLDSYADSNLRAASKDLLPWNWIRHKARAKAFYEAADLVRRAASMVERNREIYL